ncbi:hypothetical protein [Eubacterium sp.]
MSKSIKQIEREEKKALKRREKLNRQKGTSGESQGSNSGKDLSAEAHKALKEIHLQNNTNGADLLNINSIAGNAGASGGSGSTDGSSTSNKSNANQSTVVNGRSEDANVSDEGFKRNKNRKKARKSKIEFEQNQEELERNKYLEKKEMVETQVPVKIQKDFLYFTTSVKKLEKRTRRLRAACVFLIVCLAVFVGLYLYEYAETKRTYQRIFDRAITDTVDTIEGKEANPISGERFYRMITAETSLVRMAAENIGMSEKNQEKLNDVYYLFVNYPKQMEGKYQEVKDIYNLLLKDSNSKEAFKKIDDLNNSIDKLGE